jgi:hypothetical protein
MNSIKTFLFFALILINILIIYYKNNFCDSSKKIFKNYINIRDNYINNKNPSLLIINNNNINYKIQFAICSIAKQELLYIREFVDYYIKLGAKKIFLYDNNEINGENFDEILLEEVKNNYVEIINYRGLYKPQKKAYNDCYINNQNNFDWMGFLDIDEYLYLENNTNLIDFLSFPQFDNCNSILINWKYYGDDNHIYYEPKPIKERFLKPFNFPDYLKTSLFYAASKSIIRTKLNISWAHFPHFLNNSNVCRPDGNKVDNPLSSPQYSRAYIKHYATKSLEEYLIKLFKGTVNSNYTLDSNSILFWFKKYYFLFNTITRKKKIYLKRNLNFELGNYLFN